MHEHQQKPHFCLVLTWCSFRLRIPVWHYGPLNHCVFLGKPVAASRIFLISDGIGKVLSARYFVRWSQIEFAFAPSWLDWGLRFLEGIMRKTPSPCLGNCTPHEAFWKLAGWSLKGKEAFRGKTCWTQTHGKPSLPQASVSWRVHEPIHSIPVAVREDSFPLQSLRLRSAGLQKRVLPAAASGLHCFWD